MDKSVATEVDNLKQWTIGVQQAANFVLPKSSFAGPADRNYNLKNKMLRKYLQHEDQTFGINIGWTDDAEPQTGVKVARWFFTRKGKDNGPIRYGETIAIGNGGQPSFVRYDERTVGINLSFSDSPAFEWKILGGKFGDPVKTKELVALYNEKSEGGECLMYFDRNIGGDIGWPSTRRFEDQAKQMAFSALQKAALSQLGL